MNQWLWAAAVLAALLIPVVAVSLRRSVADGLVALEFGGTVCAVALLLLSEGRHRQGFVDLALILAVASLIGGVAFIRFLDRMR
jgi:multisubunit Na+/H+ antiporter MnhF subunit